MIATCLGLLLAVGTDHGLERLSMVDPSVRKPVELVVLPPLVDPRPGRENPRHFHRIGARSRFGTVYDWCFHQADYQRCAAYVLGEFPEPPRRPRVGLCSEWYLAECSSTGGYVEFGPSGVSVSARLNWFPLEGVCLTVGWDLLRGAICDASWGL
jgi:hypothetical protein